MSEEIIAALARIEERINSHVDRYNRDREEITERVKSEKTDQMEFREGIIKRVDALDQKIDPVVIDHQTIMRVIKWTGAGGTTALLAYLWSHLKGEFRP